MTKRKALRATPAARVELDARLTIVQAADLHRTLTTRLANGGPLTIDGSHVEDIDTSILQLLTSLWQTSAARGVSCTWCGVSAVLRQRAVLIGVAEMLQLADPESARSQ